MGAHWCCQLETGPYKKKESTNFDYVTYADKYQDNKETSKLQNKVGAVMFYCVIKISTFPPPVLILNITIPSFHWQILGKSPLPSKELEVTRISHRNYQNNQLSCVTHSNLDIRF